MNPNRYKYTLKSFVRDLWYWLDRRRFNRHVRLGKRPIILSYSMGKVGSTTILRAIKRSEFRYAVQHIHFLNRELVDSTALLHKNSGFLFSPAHIFASRNILRLKANNPETKFCTISPVRDPVAFAVSSFFQNPYFYPDFSLQFSEENVPAIREFVSNEILHSESASIRYWNTWFEVELENLIGTSISDVGFDRERGWEIYSGSNVSAGVVKLEVLSTAFGDFSEKLLGSAVLLPQERFNNRGGVNDVYGSVVEEVKVCEKELDKIYNSKWVRFFYNDSEISDFKKRWVKTEFRKTSIACW